MRVCHVTPLPPIKSGVSNYSHELILSLREKNVNGFALSTGSSISEIETLNFSYLRFNKIISEIKKRKPDLIHYQFSGSHKNYFVMFSNLILTKKLTIPAVISIQDMPFISLIWLNDVEPIRKSIWYAFSRKIERRLCELADIIIVYSKYAKKFVCNYYEVNDDKIRIIPFGVNFKQYLLRDAEKIRIELFSNKDSLIILSGGFIYSNRGLDDLLTAFSRIKERKKISLIIFGDGPFLNDLKRLSSKLGITNNITFTGYIPHVKMSDYLKACDFIVSPRKSTCGETSSVLVNAIAAGKPVITTDIGANSELVLDGKNGFLIRPNDIDSLVCAMDTLIHDRNLRFKMSQKSLEIAKSLDWDSVCNQMIRVYNETIRLGD